MAKSLKYHCERCGYTLDFSSSEKVVLDTEKSRMYLCHHCRDIVSVNESMALEPEMLPSCPVCGYTDLTPWDPSTGTCPKCGGKMIEE